NLNELPPAVAGIVRSSYGDATALIFLIAGVLAIITLVAVLAIREVPLRTETGIERERAEAMAAAARAAAQTAQTAQTNQNAQTAQAAENAQTNGRAHDWEPAGPTTNGRHRADGQAGGAGQAVDRPSPRPRPAPA